MAKNSPSSAGRLARTLPVFSMVGSVAYFLLMGFNIAPFAYYPQIGSLTTKFLAPESSGPPMYWYGWILYAALCGLVASCLWMLIPERPQAAITARIHWLSWAAPVGVTLATIYFLRYFFV